MKLHLRTRWHERQAKQHMTPKDWQKVLGWRWQARRGFTARPKPVAKVIAFQQRRTA